MDTLKSIVLSGALAFASCHSRDDSTLYTKTPPEGYSAGYGYTVCSDTIEEVVRTIYVAGVEAVSGIKYIKTVDRKCRNIPPNPWGPGVINL